MPSSVSPSGATSQLASRSDKQILNIAPISLSRDDLVIGRLAYTDEDAYKALRESHRETHVFRYDGSRKTIVNVSLRPQVTPLGSVESAKAKDHLLLLGKVYQHSLVDWLQRQFTILRPSRPVVFWGGNARSRLLTRAIKDCAAQSRPGLEVVVRYSIDTRVLQYPGEPNKWFLALLLDLNTSNVIDISIGDLIAEKVNVIGKYVCQRESDTEEGFRARPEALGAVSEIRGDELLLTDNVGSDHVSASDVWLEPKQENLEEVIRTLYGSYSDRILARLKELRSTYTTANGKLRHIRETLETLRSKHRISTGDGVELVPEDLLSASSELFPEGITTDRPTLLFGPQGRNTGQYPDLGVQKWGPYKYMHNEKNDPVVAVVCEKGYRGRVEQFVASLRDGFSDDEWVAATSWQKRRTENPYHGGLTGKYRLGRISLEYEEVQSPDADAYRHAVARLLSRLPKAPDFALVQIRKAFELLYGGKNPYLIAKAGFMQAGVPVQAVHIESVEASAHQVPRILNNISLSSYSKMGGTPWVISTRNPTSHELVIGLGYAEAAETRLGEKTRYVGITTLFQGDGRYAVWGLTREVEFSDYATALLESLRTTIRHVREENDWRGGDEVRLIFHVYKPLKYKEIDAIKALVATMVSDQFSVKYAFLDLSHYHGYQLFDPSEQGVSYSSGRGSQSVKGVGVPRRGIALQLDSRTALLQLTGPAELKTASQGIPRPLRIELHKDSDFTDLTYLVRQIYHFTYVSWRSYFPAAEPVTIAYSRMIAKALGSLRPVPGWNSSVLTVGSLRSTLWFL
jgi:hypothetical protein